MKEQNINDFRVSAKQLCEAHGVTRQTIQNWAAEGAFPHITQRRNAAHTYRYFRNDTISLTLGAIKKNISARRYVDPEFYKEDVAPVISKAAASSEIKDISAKLDEALKILRQLA